MALVPKAPKPLPDGPVWQDPVERSSSEGTSLMGYVPKPPKPLPPGPIGTDPFY
jgi:hypothetical protein